MGYQFVAWVAWRVVRQRLDYLLASARYYAATRRTRTTIGFRVASFPSLSPYHVLLGIGAVGLACLRLATAEVGTILSNPAAGLIVVCGNFTKKIQGRF